MGDCVFCKMANGKISVEKIYENDNFFSIFDREPEVPGHSLVISKKHFETALDLPNSLGSEFLNCVKETTLILIKKYKATGFNLISNGFKDGQQVIPHFHVHILPRKKDDGEIKFIQ